MYPVCFVLFVLFQILASCLYTLGGCMRWQGNWVPVIYMGDLDEKLHNWLLPGPTLVIFKNLKISSMRDFCRSVSLSLCLPRSLCLIFMIPKCILYLYGASSMSGKNTIQVSHVTWRHWCRGGQGLGPSSCAFQHTGRSASVCQQPGTEPCL